MKSSRVKNIVIVILLIANAFLLFLLLRQQAESRALYEASLSELSALYEKNGIVLNVGTVPDTADFPALAFKRDRSVERRFAQALLGGEVTESGGDYSAADKSGSCSFSSGGTLNADVHRRIDDPAQFAAGLFSSFGFRQVSGKLSEDGNGVLVALQYVNDLPLYGCRLLLTFEKGELSDASGCFVSGWESGTSERELSEPDALTAFLNAHISGTAGGTRVTGLSEGYLLSGTASLSPQILSVLRVQTDIFSYYVNLTDGTVFRE